MARTIIDKEKRLLPTFIIGTLLTVLTGFLIWGFGRSGYAIQLTGLVHIAAGLLWSALFLYYTGIHFSRTIGSRKIGLNASGILLTLVGVGAIITGVILVFNGFSTQKAFYHWFFAIILVILFISHIIQNRLSLRDKAKAKNNLPLIESTHIIKAFAWTGVSLLLLVFTSSLLTPDQKTLFKTVDNYEHTYGENPFAPSNTQTPGQRFIHEQAVAGSGKCQSCHDAIFRQWQSSVHRYAAADPSYVRNVLLLEKNKGISATRYCEGCHAPVALLTGQLTPGGKHGGIEGTIAFDEGVGCRSCHSIDRVVSTEGVASFHFQPTEATVFEFANNNLTQSLNHVVVNTMPDDHIETFGHSVQKTSQFCATCHAQFMDERMNDWGWVKMQDEFSAWQASPYSGHQDKTYSTEKVTRCQDCHMPLVKADDPSANNEGMVRSHRFFGANTFVAQHFNEHEQLEGTIDFLQKNKMRISIEEPRRKDSIETRLTVDQRLKEHSETPYFAYLGETIPINILVSNIGVGHNFPGGTIDLNEAWLHIEVLDARGKTVASQGTIDSEGFVDPKAQFYKSVPVNRHGQEVWRHDLFNMTGKGYRNIIKAGETDRIVYPLSVPAWVKPPVTVYATLKYRKLNRRYSNWVMKGEDYSDIPVIDVARTSLQIPVLKEPPVYQARPENNKK